MDTRNGKPSCKAAITVFLLVLILNGCVIPHHRVVVNETPLEMVNHITLHFPTSLYRLATGDVLEFIYLTSIGATAGPYRLGIKDALDVEFTYQPELNRTVRVRPDGKISIPRKDDVSVIGMTADDVKRMLKRTYADLLKDPDITVTVREFNAKLDELQKTLATAPNGQARVVAVRPDGHMSLPLIPDVKAEGLTVPQLTDNVNKLYSRIMPNMNVSVILKEVVGEVIFVDGEVARPGVFSTRGQLTVQQAIAIAGGTRETAEPRTVLVVSKGPDGRFLARTTDLTKLTSASDFMLKRNDLVYVPRSTIARADIWVDQNIRRLLMFTGWSLGLQTEVGRTTVR
ncbi:MAG TPA: polysaccharide biosynthesis/export family protein [Desulfomonilaceae bacterium]|nr:polysaccharide biosynthesis/export family protein [Desulfomonilaceae bacterium]